MLLPIILPTPLNTYKHTSSGRIKPIQPDTRSAQVKRDYNEWAKKEAKKTKRKCVDCKGTGLTDEALQKMKRLAKVRMSKPRYISGRDVCFRCDGTGKELHGGRKKWYC